MQAKHRKRIWANKGKTRVHRNTNKYNRDYKKVACSTKILHVGQLSLPPIWSECINCIRTDSMLEEELIPFTIAKSRKAIHWWNCKINQQVFFLFIYLFIWLQESPLKDITFKAIMIMPNLLLQKPLKNSKAKDHLKALERHLESWISDDLLELLKEAQTIQQSLRSKKHLET